MKLAAKVNWSAKGKGYRGRSRMGPLHFGQLSVVESTGVVSILDSEGSKEVM
jgi:hypothetical protein